MCVCVCVCVGVCVWCRVGGGGGDKSLHCQQKLMNILHYCVDLDIEYKSWNEYWNSFFSHVCRREEAGGGGGGTEDEIGALTGNTSSTKIT